MERKVSKKWWGRVKEASMEVIDGFAEDVEHMVNVYVEEPSKGWWNPKLAKLAFWGPTLHIVFSPASMFAIFLKYTALKLLRRFKGRDYDMSDSMAMGIFWFSVLFWMYAMLSIFGVVLTFVMFGVSSFYIVLYAIRKKNDPQK